MTRRLLFLFIYTLGSLAFFGQNLDSLKLVLKKSNVHDTMRLKALIALINESPYGEFEQYVEPLRLEASKIISKKSKSSLAFAQKSMAVYYDTKAFLCRERSEGAIAILYLDSAIELTKVMKRDDLLPRFYENKGMLLSERSELLLALEMFQLGLTQAEKNKDTLSIMKLTASFAVAFKKLGQFKEALRFGFKSLRLTKLLGHKRHEIDNYNILGFIYSEQDRFDSAYFYSLQACNLARGLNDVELLPNSLNNVGYDLLQLGRYEEALKYYSESATYIEKYGRSPQLANLLNNISRTYYKLKRLPEAKKQGERALEIATATHDRETLKNTYTNLSDIYRDLKDYKRSLQMLDLYIAYRDTLTDIDMRKEATKKQMNYIFEKKQLADSLKVDEDKKITTLQLKQEKNQRYALYIGLSLVLVFAVFIYNRFKVTQKQKKIIEIQKEEVEKQKHVVEEQKSLIEEKHKEITDSINYAERIQRSFMATKELLDANLTEYFVLFRPKDVVSGDFYWASKMHDGRFIVATADSTGHGVPGAIMSLLNITSIEGAIKDGHTSAADILNETRKSIIERLKKDGSIDGGKDGMDCSICIYDMLNMKIQIAAANNPIWIARQNKENGLYEMLENKPDKMPVGKHDKQDSPFTQHDLDLKKGDIVYTLTDGFPDQFGGPLGKKFMGKKLRELLLTNAHLPLAQQKEIFFNSFINWVGELEQIDDVTLIGIKI
ncbi:MAG: tetratricopeptide repeat protein [Bacteroidia bacterium]|nr:tetratricopeptide repeat protein [Bacteroidia bacterium]